MGRAGMCRARLPATLRTARSDRGNQVGGRPGRSSPRPVVVLAECDGRRADDSGREDRFGELPR